MGRGRARGNGWFSLHGEVMGFKLNTGAFNDHTYFLAFTQGSNALQGLCRTVHGERSDRGVHQNIQSPWL